jgi:prepilin-type N-terminal cleavage/methylation domain-containing protein
MKFVRSCRTSCSRSHRAGFSLVEMIGVLAIIAILAVIIVPRVFSTIASSRITNTVASVNSAKTTISEFAGKYGTIPVTNANARIDDLLLTAGMLDSRFQVKVGTQPASPPVAGATWTNTSGTWTAAGGANQNGQSRLICLTSTTATPSTANGANYQLDGSTDLPSGARVVSASVVNCTAADALELSKRIDGESLSQAAAGTADDEGKVVYRAPNAQGLTTVYVYLAHQ